MKNFLLSLACLVAASTTFAGAGMGEQECMIQHNSKAGQLVIKAAYDWFSGTGTGNNYSNLKVTIINAANQEKTFEGQGRALARITVKVNAKKSLGIETISVRPNLQNPGQTCEIKVNGL